MTPDDIRGLEYDWLATDLEGHVGFFSTAGAGYAPAAFLRDVDAHDAGIAALKAQPATTIATSAPVLRPDLENEWRLMAERGVFAYDSNPNGGPYELVAVPRDAITIAHLSDSALRAAASVRLGIRFGVQSLVGDELADGSAADD
jgi:hypothetical protein